MPAAGSDPACPLGRVQRGLEALYRVDTGVEVGDFVVGAELRDALVSARRPREQLLVCEGEGEMALALFIDPRALANLVRFDPARRLGDHNLGDFLLAVEGVSHFIYAVCCARVGRPVSQLELELQAEVDKYVTCLLCGHLDRSAALRRRLFEQFSFEPDLDDEERDRYRTANSNAQRYSASLERRYVSGGRIADMLGELRRFYRLPLDGKLDHIRAA
ncbi:MAG TPA: hypothetical protein VFD36_11845 [Kofleriaceae bacterium]|nr:hypothetical protein [Kofleriaceae bacterium]